MSRVDYIGIAKQSAYGTKNATPAFFIPIGSEAINLHFEQIQQEETTGVRGGAAPIPGTQWCIGPIVGPCRPDSFPILCSGAFGSPVSTQPDASGNPGVYKHVFDPDASGNAQPLSIATVNKDPATDVIDLWYDCYVETLRVKGGVNQITVFEAGIFGANLDNSQSAPSPTLDSTPRLTGLQVTAQMDSGSGLADLQIADFDILFTHLLNKADYKCGSAILQSIPEGNIKAEGTFTVRGSDIHTHYRRAQQSSPTDCRLVVTVTGPNIPSKSLPYKFIFDIKRLNYLEAPLDINAEANSDFVKVSAGAYAAVADDKLLEFTIQNANAGTSY